MKHAIGSKIKLGLWVISAVVIGVFLASLVSKNIPYKESDKNTAIAIESVMPSETIPKYFYFTKDPNQKPKVSAGAYLVGDLDTGEVILSTNPDDTAKVSKKALTTYGENGNFKLGEKIKITDLIYPLLLESSNDAAEIIAEYFKRDIFIKKMNQMVNKLELSKTIFEDPSGLSSKNQSTVEDMFKLAGYINQKKPDLFQITTKRSYSNIKHNWSSNNQFLHEDGYLGGKSGFTDPALQTAISLFSIPLGETGVRNIAITILQSKDRFKDVEKREIAVC